MMQTILNLKDSAMFFCLRIYLHLNFLVGNIALLGTQARARVFAWSSKGAMAETEGSGIFVAGLVCNVKGIWYIQIQSD